MKNKRNNCLVVDKENPSYHFYNDIIIKVINDL